MNLPILYSFRRCPYAIRARMALAYADVTCELREISLRNKPLEMLAISPKGTTPVLQLTDGRVIEESLEIMYWALSQGDRDRWLGLSVSQLQLTEQLINRNDLEFKQSLDRYKYFNRFPEYSQEFYREQAEVFMQYLEQLLQNHQFLLAERITLIDIAVFPFIRQFAYVDWEWFGISIYKRLKQWLNWHEQSDLFQHVMQKSPEWSPDEPKTFFSPLSPLFSEYEAAR